MDGYLWAKGPQWSQPHIRRDGKFCVLQTIVSQVIQAVHACADPGQAKTLEQFLRRFHADMPYARLRETVNKALSDYGFCAQAKARCGPHPDSCKQLPVPSFPLSSVAIDFVDLPEVGNQSTKTKVFANYAMVRVCRLTGYVMAIPCCKEGLTSRKAAKVWISHGLTQRKFQLTISRSSAASFSMRCAILPAFNRPSLLYIDLSGMAGLRGLCRVPSILCGSTFSAGG